MSSSFCAEIFRRCNEGLLRVVFTASPIWQSSTCPTLTKSFDGGSLFASLFSKSLSNEDLASNFTISEFASFSL